jgi:hypothetical protein
LILSSIWMCIFLLNVVICCCMLHNMILNGKDTGIDQLMQQLDT